MRPLPNLADRVRVVRAPIKVSVPVRGVGANGWGHLEAVLCKIELANHRWAQQAHQIRSDRELVARDWRFGERCPAKDGASLKDEGVESGLREVCGGGESVVAAADDDRVVPFRH